MQNVEGAVVSPTVPGGVSGSDNPAPGACAAPQVFPGRPTRVLGALVPGEGRRLLSVWDTPSPGALEELFREQV